MTLLFILLLCFLPALLVLGFVKLFKKQLAANPSKQQLYKYIGIYLFVVIALGVAIFSIGSLVS